MCVVEGINLTSAVTAVANVILRTDFIGALRGDRPPWATVRRKINGTMFILGVTAGGCNNMVRRSDLILDQAAKCSAVMNLGTDQLF
jgi:hypothetical protein